MQFAQKYLNQTVEKSAIEEVKEVRKQSAEAIRAIPLNSPLNYLSSGVANAIRARAAELSGLSGILASPDWAKQVTGLSALSTGLSGMLNSPDWAKRVSELSAVSNYANMLVSPKFLEPLNSNALKIALLSGAFDVDWTKMTTEKSTVETGPEATDSEPPHEAPVGLALRQADDASKTSSSSTATADSEQEEHTDKPKE